MTGPVSLTEAIQRSQTALGDLNASIHQASLCVSRFDQLKARAVAVLGYDPTLPHDFSVQAKLQAANDMRADTAAAAAAAGEPRPTGAAFAMKFGTTDAKFEPHDSKSAAGAESISPGGIGDPQRQQQHGAKAGRHASFAHSRLRGAGGSAGASPAPEPVAAPPAPTAARAAQPAAEAGQAPSAASEGTGRFKLVTTSSDKVKLTPWQALQRQGATKNPPTAANGGCLPAEVLASAAAHAAAPPAPPPKATSAQLHRQQRQQVGSVKARLCKTLGEELRSNSDNSNIAEEDATELPQEQQQCLDSVPQPQQQQEPVIAAEGGGTEAEYSSADDVELLPLAQRQRKLQLDRQQQQQRQRQKRPRLHELPLQVQQQAQPPRQQQQEQQPVPWRQQLTPAALQRKQHHMAPGSQQQHRQQQTMPVLPQEQQVPGGPEVVVLLDSSNSGRSDEEGTDSSSSIDESSSDGSPMMATQQRQHVSPGQRPIVQSPAATGLGAVKPPLALSAMGAGPGQPGGLFGLGSLRAAGAAPATTKWYAVVKGRRPGLYRTWTDCAGQVLGFQSGEYKTCSSEQAARQYLEQLGVDPSTQQEQQQNGSGGQGGEVSAPARNSAAGTASKGAGSDSGGSAGEDGSGSGNSASGGPLGAYQSSDPVASQQYRQQFSAPAPSRRAGAAGRGGGGGGVKKVAELKRRARARASIAAPPRKAAKASAEDKREQQAWEAFARAWRQKHMPSEEEIKTLKKEQQAAAREREGQAQAAAAAMAAAATGAAPAPPTAPWRTPWDRLHADRVAASAGGWPAPAGPAAGPGADAGGATVPAGIGGAGLCPVDRRAHHRHACQAQVAGAGSFAQVLRVFKVPCEPGRLKEAYRLAVRMYHPDSNSKDKAWHTEDQKLHAEEVMKVINERKPQDL